MFIRAHEQFSSHCDISGFYNKVVLKPVYPTNYIWTSFILWSLILIKKKWEKTITRKIASKEILSLLQQVNNISFGTLLRRPRRLKIQSMEAKIKSWHLLHTVSNWFWIHGSLQFLMFVLNDTNIYLDRCYELLLPLHSLWILSDVNCDWGQKHSKNAGNFLMLWYHQRLRFS